jgi:hypothetical protein
MSFFPKECFVRVKNHLKEFRPEEWGEELGLWAMGKVPQKPAVFEPELSTPKFRLLDFWEF